MNKILKTLTIALFFSIAVAFSTTANAVNIENSNQDTQIEFIQYSMEMDHLAFVESPDVILEQNAYSSLEQCREERSAHILIIDCGDVIIIIIY